MPKKKLSLRPCEALDKLDKSSRTCEGQRYRLNIEVYFAHAHSTRERTKMKAGSPTVFPKGMDFFN